MSNDHAEITKLLYAYADAVRNRDAEAWGSLWTIDAQWVLRGPAIKGRDNIVATWNAAMAKYTHVIQIYGSSAAIIDGDAATGRAYLVELNDPVGEPRRMMASYYDDTYRRTGDGWRFSSRSLVILYSGLPDLSGTFFGPT